MRFSIFSLLTLMTITVMCLVALNFLGCFKTADDLTTIEINQILSSYNETQSDKAQQIVEDLVLFLEDKHGILYSHIVATETHSEAHRARGSVLLSSPLLRCARDERPFKNGAAHGVLGNLPPACPQTGIQPVS